MKKIMQTRSIRPTLNMGDVMDVRKVKVLEYQPHQVKLQYYPNGRIVRVSRGFFERRRNMGLLEVINPEVLPMVF
jgi:hypothetical protein